MSFSCDRREALPEQRPRHRRRNLPQPPLHDRLQARERVLGAIRQDAVGREPAQADEHVDRRHEAVLGERSLG